MLAIYTPEELRRLSKKSSADCTTFDELALRVAHCARYAPSEGHPYSAMVAIDHRHLSRINKLEVDRAQAKQIT